MPSINQVIIFEMSYLVKILIISGYLEFMDLIVHKHMYNIMQQYIVVCFIANSSQTYYVCIHPPTSTDSDIDTHTKHIRAHACLLCG